VTEPWPPSTTADPGNSRIVVFRLADNQSTLTGSQLLDTTLESICKQLNNQEIPITDSQGEKIGVVKRAVIKRRRGGLMELIVHARTRI